MKVDRSEVFERLRSIHLFRALNEQQLEQVYYHLELYAFEAGQRIYEQGQAADAFYFLHSGRVLLSVPDDGREHEVALVEVGDTFGEEALGARNARTTNATATTRTMAFCLAAEDLDELSAETPDLADALSLLEKSFYLSLKVRPRWLGQREYIRFISRRHLMFLLLRLLGPALVIFGLVLPLGLIWRLDAPQLLWPFPLLAMALLGSLAWAAWVALDWSNDYSIITNSRVVSVEKVALLYESRQEVPLEAILGSEIRTDQWARWIGYGDIVIRTYTGNIQLSKLARPDLVLQLMEAQRVRATRAKESVRQSEIRSALHRRLAGLPDPAPQPARRPVTADQDDPHPIVGLWSHLFRLRQEENGMVTYWTHWWMLVVRVWLPTLLLVGVITGMILTLAGRFDELPLTPLNIMMILTALGMLAMGWWFYQYIDWRNDRYQITGEQVVDLYKRPLGLEHKRAAPIRNIQSIEYKRHGPIGLLLNFGTVYIRIGDTVFTFNHVFNPSEVQRELFQRFMQYGLGEKQRDQERQEMSIADWIHTYHQMIENPADSGRNRPNRRDIG